ncbi:hypothetical protein NDU88_002724 [Pleurodeles waltl]|uniref:Uncharacterized protein n=1 Tax=Pleurodeles waltl TaxID=8319 RepID=A0AAV7W046_PLEWA|nr:hypothetical protein NDU88_002724 [Pleurodeles waltl]
MLLNRIHVAAVLQSSPVEYSKNGTPQLAISFGEIVIGIKNNNISTFIGLFSDDIAVGSQMFYRRYVIKVDIGSLEKAPAE